MCQACKISRPGSVLPDLQDVLVACREGQKKGAPYWLAKPPKQTDKQVAPMPLWLSKQRGHSTTTYSNGMSSICCDPRLQKDWNETVIPYPAMTDAQQRAELGRQLKRLSGKGELAE